MLHGSPDRGPGRAHHGAMTTAAALPGWTAVLAEDDPDIRMLLQASLQSWGYDVLAVGRGDESLTAIREVRPDIVLLDISMPGLTGLEVVAEMRRDPALSGIPAMLITAHGEGETAETGLENGADDFVRKPFHLGELRQRVLRLTERSRDLRALTELEQAVDLPGAVSAVNGVTAVARNRPVPGALAGADFLVVTRSPHGAVTAIAGDVEGEGADAAALAAFTRAVLATNATFTDLPGRLLSLADWTLAQRGGELPMITATCLTLDPTSGAVRWASAGHPAPVLPGAVTEPMEVGLPLGSGEKPWFPQHSRLLAPGERVLLVTDGLMRAAYGQRTYADVVLPWLVRQPLAGEPEPVLDRILAAYADLAGHDEPDLGLLLLEVPER